MAGPLGALYALLGGQAIGELPPLAPQEVPGLTPGFNPQAPQPGMPQQSMSQLPPAEQGADILVQGGQGPAPQQAVPEILQQQVPAPPQDRSVMPMTQASPQMIASQSNLEGLPEHKGMFGIKGTLRDILGTLGDTLLVGQGNKAVYAPQRSQEKFSDAAVGFNNANPQIQDQALQRMMAQNPELAQKYLEQVQMNRYRQGQLENAEVTAKAAAGKQGSADFAKGSAIYGQALRGMVNNGQYDKNLLDRIAQQYNLGEEYAAPDTPTPDWASGRIAAATSVNQQENVQLGNRRQTEVERRNPVTERIAQQQADASTLRASRPPAGRAAPRATDSERYIELSNKDPADLSRGEAAWLDKQTPKKTAADTIRDKILKNGGKPAPAKGKAPAVGYKNKNGLTFRGGDPNNRNNWR